MDETYTLDDYITDNGLLDNKKFKLKPENDVNMLTVDFYTDNNSIDNYATYLSNEENKKIQDKNEENKKIQDKNEAFTKALSIVDYPSNKIGIVKISIETELNILLNSDFSIENTKETIKTIKTIKDLLTKDIELCIKPTSFYYVDNEDNEYKYDLKNIYIDDNKKISIPIYRLFDPIFDDDYVYFKINSQNDEKFLKEMFDYIDKNEDFENETYIFIGKFDATFNINTLVTEDMKTAISNYNTPL